MLAATSGGGVAAGQPAAASVNTTTPPPVPAAPHHLAMGVAAGQFGGSSPVSKFWTPIQRLHQLNEFLSCDGEYWSLDYWERFARDFFADGATMRITLFPGAAVPSSSNAKPATDSQARTYEIPVHLLPRMFLTWAASGLVLVQFIFQRVKESFWENHHIIFDSTNCRLLSRLEPDGCLIEQTCDMRILFTFDSRIARWEMGVRRVDEFVSRSKVLAAMGGGSAGHEHCRSEAGKAGRGDGHHHHQQQQQHQQHHNAIVFPIHPYGFTNRILRFFEVTAITSGMLGDPRWLMQQHSTGQLHASGGSRKVPISRPGSSSSVSASGRSSNSLRASPKVPIPPSPSASAAGSAYALPPPGLVPKIIPLLSPPNSMGGMDGLGFANVPQLPTFQHGLPLPELRHQPLRQPLSPPPGDLAGGGGKGGKSAGRKRTARREHHPKGGTGETARPTEALGDESRREEASRVRREGGPVYFDAYSTLPHQHYYPQQQQQQPQQYHQQHQQYQHNNNNIHHRQEEEYQPHRGGGGGPEDHAAMTLLPEFLGYTYCLGDDGRLGFAGALAESPASAVGREADREDRVANKGEPAGPLEKKQPPPSRQPPPSLPIDQECGDQGENSGGSGDGGGDGDYGDGDKTERGDYFGCGDEGREMFGGGLECHTIDPSVIFGDFSSQIANAHG